MSGVVWSELATGGPHLDFEKWGTMNLDGLLFVFLTAAGKTQQQAKKRQGTT